MLDGECEETSRLRGRADRLAAQKQRASVEKKWAQQCWESLLIRHWRWGELIRMCALQGALLTQEQREGEAEPVSITAIDQQRGIIRRENQSMISMQRKDFHPVKVQYLCATVNSLWTGSAR